MKSQIQLGNTDVRSESDLQHSLLSKSPPDPAQSDSCLNKLKNYFRRETGMHPRTIIISSQGTKNSNIIRNQKYSLASFVPVVLFDQFKYFFNFFYLLIALTQFIPGLQVGLLFTYVAPLVLVISLTMVKQAYDDYQRYRKDLQANSTEYRNGEISKLKSMDLKVGDVVQITAHNRIPADLIFLWSEDPQGNIFIKTDQMDGQTDWKLRKASSLTQRIISEQGVESIVSSKLQVQASEPMVNIYKMQARLVLSNREQGLDLTNSGWASTVLATGRAWGLVVYIGKEMRIALNGRKPRNKFGRLDQQLNSLSKMLFVAMCIAAFILVLLRGLSFKELQSSVYLFVCYVILLSNVIPISMRVNLDFAKLYYSLKINRDSSIHQTIVRNSNIPQELGMIECLLTDKTGTLTKNQMIFRKISIQAGTYTYQEADQLKAVLQRAEQLGQSPCQDLQGKYQRGKYVRRAKQAIILDLIFAVAICHNVTPVIESGQRVLQSSSPDEVALVEMAQKLGLTLKSRTQRRLVVCTAAVQYSYDILMIFPFSSEEKRMAIIVRDQKGRIILYLKGADTQLKPRVYPMQGDIMFDYCQELARDGLRTMVFAQRILTQEQWLQVQQKQKSIKAMMADREINEKAFRKELQSNMQFLGVSGVQDCLQEQVKDTLQSLKNAGVKIWMLTGDKIETALCISISTGLKGPTQQSFIIRDIQSKQAIIQKLNEFSRQHNNILVIDGVSLKTANSHCLQLFINVASKAPALICSRCSPTQKAQVVEALKNISKKRCCAVGDGGNDVGMIQAADVGVGVVGKQGIQAALASDFSISQFRFLKKLSLWHGRLSYKRSCVLSQFIMHRGMIISVNQMIFIVLFFFITVSMYNGLLLLGYSTIFTMFPVFSMILDQDVDQIAALQYPQLYKSMQKGRDLNARVFIGWMFLSVYQGFLIMMLALAFFGNNTVYMLQTITFSALIIIEFLNVFTSIRTPHLLMIISTLLSLLIYMLTLFLLKNYLNVEKMDWAFFGKIFGIVAITWIPPFVLQIVFRHYFPADFEKVMKERKKGFQVNTAWI